MWSTLVTLAGSLSLAAAAVTSETQSWSNVVIGGKNLLEFVDTVTNTAYSWWFRSSEWWDSVTARWQLASNSNDLYFLYRDSSSTLLKKGSAT